MYDKPPPLTPEEQVALHAIETDLNADRRLRRRMRRRWSTTVRLILVAVLLSGLVPLAIALSPQTGLIAVLVLVVLVVVSWWCWRA